MRGALPGVAGWGRGVGVCEPWLGRLGSLFEDEFSSPWRGCTGSQPVLDGEHWSSLQ